MGDFIYEPKDHQLFITLSGKFTQEDHPKYIAAFTEGLSKVNPKDCKLIFDATNFQVLTADMRIRLAECFKLYQGCGFKKIIMYVEDNFFVNMQVKRIAAEVGLTNYEIIQ